MNSDEPRDRTGEWEERTFKVSLLVAVVVAVAVAERRSETRTRSLILKSGIFLEMYILKMNNLWDLHEDGFIFFAGNVFFFLGCSC